MHPAGEGNHSAMSSMSSRADDPENPYPTETSHADERDYPTDEDDGGDGDGSDSDDDDIPLGPLGELVDSECDRPRQQYVASQGSATEREARLLWQSWEDATMFIRSESILLSTCSA
jgi:hypothetical protein